jgi:diguanylate cyclase (GGDEF)-like protein
MNGGPYITRLCDLHLQPGYTVHADERVENLMQMIKSQKSTHHTFVVMERSRPVGIIRSSDMFRILGTRYGVALNYKKRLREVMDPDFLVVDGSTPVEEASRKALARSYKSIYDDIVVTNEGHYAGVLPVYVLLTYLTEWKVREAAQSNPLTGLPGNERIREELDRKIKSLKPFTMIYTDIDHFKPYNDVYGFKNGDDVLKWISGLLQEPSVPDLFVGHIGGDDFITCLLPEDAIFYCQQVISRFEHGKRTFYTEEDAERGVLVSLDRDHQLKQFPLISLSMAIVDIHPSVGMNVDEVSVMAAGIKKRAKQMQGSNYYRECLNDCFSEKKTR